MTTHSPTASATLSAMASDAREIRLRERAKRRGLRLERSRRRDPLAVGYGLYRVLDASGELVAGDPASDGGYSLSLDQAMAVIDGGQR